MKNNPLLQICKMLAGVAGFIYCGYRLLNCWDPYHAWIWLLLYLASAGVAFHGWIKFRGKEY